jgi:nucleotide-binding universal stress UspA family protein
MRSADLHVVYVTDVTPAILHMASDVTIDTVAIARIQQEAVWKAVTPLIEGLEGVEVSRVDLDGYPADRLVDYCDQQGAELLVVGTRGRGRLAATFLGSTSSRALEHAHCDVLVAKPRKPVT